MYKVPEIIEDQFGRVHDYRRISLTERCNLRCTYCMPAGGIQLRPRAHFMQADEVFRIAETFVQLGIKKIRLTGGEPLVRRDIADIITKLSQLPVELAITTNGVLVNEFIDVFKAGNIRKVNVSIDSLQQEKMKRITRRDHLQRILNNIDLLVKEGLYVKLNVVLVKGVNEEEIADFIGWTKDYPIHVRFIEFMPFDGNKWNWEEVVTYQQMLEKIKGFYGNDHVLRLTDEEHDTAKNYQIKGHNGTFAIISSVTEPFCDSCSRIRLTADGKLKNCLFSAAEADLLNPLRKGEDIIPLILSSMRQKHLKWGGLDTLSDFMDPELNSTKRSMVSIGG